MTFIEHALVCPAGHDTMALGGLPAPIYTCTTCGFSTGTLRDLERGPLRAPDAHGFPRRAKGRRTLRRRAG